MNVIVTGAASGIGKGLVEELSKRNHRVWALDVDEARLVSNADQLGWNARKVTWRAFDVRQPDHWKDVIDDVVQQFGQLDVLLNVAGVVRPEFAHQLTPENIALQVDVNTKGLLLGCQAAARVMAEKGVGHIVNIASLAGIAPIRGISVYSATKFAVRGFSLAIAQELAPMGIHVSVVCPDAVDTPMVDYQLHFPEAAMTFSGPRVLTTDEVVRSIMDEVLVRKPLEAIIPKSRSFQVRLASMLPSGWMRKYSEHLSKKGLAAQERIKSAGKENKG
ncbi:SDR family oxidoreductase [bacterium]|nr:SDR family oxidoreductase [bacterium]